MKAPLGRLVAALTVLVVSSCATSVPGHAVRAAGAITTEAKAPITARELLLQDGGITQPRSVR